MRRYALPLVCIALFTPFAAAQQQPELDVGPGMITPNSPFYGLEVAMDKAAMAVGLAKPSGVAQERAAEVRAMAAKNDTKAMQKAADSLSAVAKKAKGKDTQGLQKAAAVLQAVMNRTPQQAQQGLQTALNNIPQAQQRIGGPGQGAGQGAGRRDGVNATARIQEARQLREQGRRALQRGNRQMDAGNYSEARAAFQTASDRFAQALVKLQGVNTETANQLRDALRNAQSGANNLERAIEAYQNNNTQDAERYADRAAQDFTNTGTVQDGGRR